MTIDPAVLDALLQAGATAEMIVAAVKADMAKDEARREARRANNADRQRRFKARRRGEVVADNAGNALPSVTERDPSLSRPLSPQTPHTPTHTHPDNITPRVKGCAVAKPDDVPPQVWTDFLAHRRAQKAPVSETAVAGMRREAGKAGWTLADAMAECVSRGWRGFKADWVQAPPAKPPDGGDFMSHLISRREGIAR